MTSTVSIALRLPPSEVVPILRDKGLGHWKKLLRDVGGGESCARLRDADPARLKAFLSEVEQLRSESGSLLRCMDIRDEFALQDLHDAGEYVELDISDKVDDILPVSNYREAMECRFTCAQCSRVACRQVAPIKVAKVRRFGMMRVLTGSWIVAERFVPAFEKHGLRTEPVLGARGFRQLVIESEFDVDLENWPIAQSEPCAACGEPKVLLRNGFRSGKLGDYESQFAATRVAPLSLGREIVDAGLAVSRQTFGRYSGKPSEPPGQVIPLKEIRYLYQAVQFKWFVIRRSLMTELVEMGITGVTFRPLRLTGTRIPEPVDDIDARWGFWYPPAIPTA